jgi:hypothetical protein
VCTTLAAPWVYVAVEIIAVAPAPVATTQRHPCRVKVVVQVYQRFM